MAYGYTAPSYGGYQRAPKQQPLKPVRSLAQAAAGGGTSASDPYGLISKSLAANPQGGSVYSGPQMPSIGDAQRAIGAKAPAAAPAAQQQQAAAQPAPIPQITYSLEVDPALQQIQAYTGLNDQQASSAAMKQRQDQLLAYGDAGLAKSVTGDNALAQAAGQNPHSTLAQYQTQRDRGVHDMTEGYNKNNLLYSGARIVGEQQAAQDYQNLLAEAAAGVNTNLGQIGANEAAAHGQNEMERGRAMQEAASRQMQADQANQLAIAQAERDNQLALAIAGLSGLGGGGGADAGLAGALGGDTGYGERSVGANSNADLLAALTRASRTRQYQIL